MGAQGGENGLDGKPTEGCVIHQSQGKLRKSANTSSPLRGVYSHLLKSNVDPNGNPREGYPLVTASASMYGNIAAISVN